MKSNHSGWVLLSSWLPQTRLNRGACLRGLCHPDSGLMDAVQRQGSSNASLVHSPQDRGDDGREKALRGCHKFLCINDWERYEASLDGTHAV